MSKIPELMSGRSLEHSATINGPVYTKRGVTNHPAAKVGGQILTTTNKTLANTTVPTNLANVTLPAGTLTAGTVIRVCAVGSITNQNATDTLGLKLKLGAAEVVVIAPRDPATGDLFHVYADIHIAVAGASGTLATVGRKAFMAAGAPYAETVLPVLTAAFDTTGPLVLALEGTWSFAHVNNVAVLHSMSAEVVG